MRLYGEELEPPMMLGTALYPSPAVMAAAFRASGAKVATVSLRRETAAGATGRAFWRLVSGLGVRILPNTAGCHTVKEALTTAAMAREVFRTDWVKLEVIGNPDTLQPDVFGLVEAARLLASDGFKVFPYTTEDLVVAERLLTAGCEDRPWPDQRVRAADTAGAAAGNAADRRRWTRPAVTGGAGHGARV